MRKKHSRVTLTVFRTYEVEHPDRLVTWIPHITNLMTQTLYEGMRHNKQVAIGPLVFDQQKSTPTKGVLHAEILVEFYA